MIDPDGLDPYIPPCAGVSCTASPDGRRRVKQWREFFYWFPGVRLTKGGWTPYRSSPWGSAMVEFLEWIIDSGRFTRVRWWEIVDRVGEVQPSLTAWKYFEKKIRLNPPGGIMSRASATDVWSSYVWRYTRGSIYVKAGYHGAPGTRLGELISSAPGRVYCEPPPTGGMFRMPSSWSCGKCSRISSGITGAVTLPMTCYGYSGRSLSTQTIRLRYEMPAECKTCRRRPVSRIR